VTPAAAPTRRPSSPRVGADVAGGTPWPLALPAVVAALFLLVPLASMIVRAPWQDLPETLVQTQALQALRLSLETATAATALSLLFGVPLAWVLARARFPGLGLLRALVTLPLVLPPVVGGVALLLAFGRLGLVGRFLDQWLGVQLPFSTAGVVVAETFVAMPFLVVTVEGALRSADLGLEEAAATLGSRRFATFRRVTLPLVAPSLVAGSVLSWARALGEFGATITFAGNLPGRTQTMPLAIDISQSSGKTDEAIAIALSLILVVVSLVVMIFRRRLAGGD